MGELVNDVRNGWSETKSEVSESQRPYDDYKDEPSVVKDHISTKIIED